MRSEMTDLQLQPGTASRSGRVSAFRLSGWSRAA